MLGTPPGPVRDGVTEAFARAFGDSFLAGLPLLAAGAAAALPLRHVPLGPRE